MITTAKQQQQYRFAFRGSQQKRMRHRSLFIARIICFNIYEYIVCVEMYASASRSIMLTITKIHYYYYMNDFPIRIVFGIADRVGVACWCAFPCFFLCLCFRNYLPSIMVFYVGAFLRQVFWHVFDILTLSIIFTDDLFFSFCSYRREPQTRKTLVFWLTEANNCVFMAAIASDSNDILQVSNWHRKSVMKMKILIFCQRRRSWKH